MLAGADPLVYEVPRGGASLADQRRAMFVAAPFRVDRGRVVRGEWRSSDDILGPGSTHVVVVASWCPACKALLSRVGRNPAARAPVILFLEDEYALRAGGPAGGASPGDPVLSDAAILDGFPRELWLLRAGSALERTITHYPFHLVCTRDTCRPARR